jgi:uncharacterized protein YggE
MKTRAIALASLALLLVLTLSAWATSQSESAEPRTITVTGDAQLRVVPDEVILTLGVETWDKNMDRAKEQNDAIIRAVLALAVERGIAAEHVQTDYVNIEPRYHNGYYEERDFIGYFVRKSVVITLRDLSQFEDLLADSLKAGVNYVQGIEFRTTELREHRDEARALAIQAAQEKAEALAGELGQGLGEPTVIQEQQSGWWSGYASWWGSSWGNTLSQNVIQEIGSLSPGTGDNLAPGQININARVSVTFELSD